MNDSPSAERSVARADVADSADRSATLWMRAALFGTTAVVMAAGAVFLFASGSWLKALLALAAALGGAQRVVAACREEKRVFALAVETLEGNRDV